jgi:competence protein ComQ
MRLALHSKSEGGRDPSVWAALPGLCCQAAGGEAQWTDAVAAAWLLFYAAAHLMDSVEDQDEPDPWWAMQGPGLALNAATGLYFSACLALEELDDLPISRQTQRAAAVQVLQPFLLMSSGQFADFNTPEPTLEEYWRIASAKSGAFFSLACQAGARLATDRPEVLEGFQQFGLNMGLLIQILDDLGDYRDLTEQKGAVDARSLLRSLPAAYLREVCTGEIIERFNRLVWKAGHNPEAAAEIVQMIEGNGGVLYLLAELDKRRSLALTGLKRAAKPSPAREALAALLDKLQAPST